MVRISVFAHKCMGDNQKKNSSARYLRLRLGVHSWFLSWNKILLTLGGAQAVFWGGTGPEMHYSGTMPITFFWGTILAWEAHISRLGGTSSDFGGGTAPKCPPWHRAWRAPIPLLFALLFSFSSSCLYLNVQISTNSLLKCQNLHFAVPYVQIIEHYYVEWIVRE